jgi:hypothetical protein
MSSQVAQGAPGLSMNFAQRKQNNLTHWATGMFIDAKKKVMRQHALNFTG